MVDTQQHTHSGGSTSLLDLIQAGLLSVGTKVLMRDIEGELTEQGTILSTTDKGSVEYKTPTAFSKAVTNSTSGGWHQVKLKSSGGTTSLFDIKRKFSGYTKRVRDGTTKRRNSTGTRTKSDQDPSRPRARKEKLSQITFPILVRFRDDNTKCGMINRVSADKTTFELEYKGKTYPALRAAELAKEMCKENPEDASEAVNSVGIEDLNYKTSTGDWGKLRDLLPTPRKRKSIIVNEEDEVSGTDQSPSPPPLTPPSPSSSISQQLRNTTIAKHIKTSHHVSEPSAPALEKLPSPTYTNGKVHSQSSPPPTPNRRQTKDIELLVYMESADSIPYEVLGNVDSYEGLSYRISRVVPNFSNNQPHEIGIYSEYWEKHAGVPYVKPPPNWADFPACTSLLVKKITDTFIINQFDM